MLYKKEEFEQFPRRYRANFFNSLLGYKSANLVGTVSETGVENLAIFSSAMHLGANPPLVGLVCRPDSVPRHTLENLRKTGFFTLNHVSESLLEEAHQSSANYPAIVSEFESLNLTPVYLDGFNQPFVQESEVRIGLQLREIVPISLNDTYFIIGEIINVAIDSDHVISDGSLDFEALNTIAVTGLDTYHKPIQISKLPYARP